MGLYEGLDRLLQEFVSNEGCLRGLGFCLRGLDDRRREVRL